MKTSLPFILGLLLLAAPAAVEAQSYTNSEGGIFLYETSGGTVTIYGYEGPGVVTIPTNVPAIRKDFQDLVYKTKREKYKAVIDEIDKLRTEGRPSLVGTTSVEVSELLSKMLQVKKIPHNVLNAKQHAREAQVVAEAGLPGAVTIATVSSSSPFGPIQVSASPARPIGAPSRRWMKCGRLRFSDSCHS